MTDASVVAYARAGARAALLGPASGAVLVAGVAAAVLGWLAGDPVLRGLAGLSSASLLVAGSGLFAAWRVCAARARLAEAQDAARIAPTSGLFAGAGPMDLSAERSAVVAAAGWRHALIVLPWPALAVAALVVLRPGMPADGGGVAWGLAACALAFPLLVLERVVAAATDLPEHAALARLLRLPLWTLLGAGAVTCAVAGGWPVAGWLLWPLFALNALIAVELAARAAARPFTAATEADRAIALGDSLVAHVLLARGDPVSAITEGLRDRMGVDLTRSWALRFAGKALLPVAGGVLLLGWLLTGFSVIRLGERGIYERSGVPVAVLPAGPHLHLPYPFGVVRRVEDGAVHETVLAAEAAAPAQVAAVGDPGDGLDRLWDVAHPSESEHLVPAPGAGFQLVSCDARVRWSIGGGDDDARLAAYRLADPATTIAASARRHLTAAFAAMPLDTLIAADRAVIARRVADGVTADLAAILKTTGGIRIDGVLIDAIHPPVAAAAAWHGVRAAEIGAQGARAVESAVAARAVAEARREGAARLRAAEGTAAEARHQAAGEAARFAADASAWATAGPALAVERQLDAMRKAWARTDPIIIDHRLPGPAATIDLRPTGAPKE